MRFTVDVWRRRGKPTPNSADAAGAAGRTGAHFG